MMTLEEFEAKIQKMYGRDFRIDITTTYKDKSIFLDFGYGDTFETTATHIDDAMRSIINQLEGWLNDKTDDDETLVLDAIVEDMVALQEYVDAHQSSELKIGDIESPDVLADIDFFISACKSQKIKFEAQHIYAVIGGSWPEVNGVDVINAYTGNA